MKFKKLFIAVAAATAVTVSCGSMVCYAAKTIRRRPDSDISDNAYAIISKADDILDSVISHDYVATQADINNAAEQLSELNKTVKREHTPIYQEYADIVWKTDYVLSNAKNADSLNLSDINTEISEFEEYAKSVSNKNTDAVG